MQTEEAAVLLPLPKTPAPRPPKRCSPAKCCLTGSTRVRTLNRTGRVWTWFLVRGNEQYQDLINRGLLAKLNTNLGAEGKTLNDYIYPTFINAATINKSIYGVPMNTGIGEYEYIVFDTELLEKYGVDAATMKTMEDLEVISRSSRPTNRMSYRCRRPRPRPNFLSCSPRDFLPM